MTVDSYFPDGGACRPRRCRVALLGLGTVGSAVAGRLAGAERVDGLELTHILDRRAFVKRDALLSRTKLSGSIVWTTRLDDVLCSDADVVVEAIGGVEPAVEWTRAALLSGKSVVTANKQVIAQHGPALLALAERQGRQIRFEAAVGGAMPIVRAVSDGLAGDRVTRIVAILNGTSNAVLSRMDATGCTLAQALDWARAQGWTGADASSDLDGLDARAKLAILCALGFRLRVDPARIETRSVECVQPGHFESLRPRSATIRQIAYARYDWRRRALTAWVAPAVVSSSSFLGRTTGPQNAAVISGEHAGDLGVVGVGAGGEATAVAVIGDLLTIARDRAAIVPAPGLTIPERLSGIRQPGDIIEFIAPDGPPAVPEAARLAEAV